MIVFELPTVFLSDGVERVDYAKFRIFNPSQIITNKSSNSNRTTLRFSGFDEGMWLIDAQKDVVDEIIDQAIESEVFYD